MKHLDKQIGLLLLGNHLQLVEHVWLASETAQSIKTIFQNAILMCVQCFCRIQLVQTAMAGTWKCSSSFFDWIIHCLVN